MEALDGGLKRGLGLHSTQALISDHKQRNSSHLDFFVRMAKQSGYPIGMGPFLQGASKRVRLQACFGGDASEHFGVADVLASPEECAHDSGVVFVSGSMILCELQTFKREARIRLRRNAR